jgi:ABC-type Fe3+/spermidine/putrescine transport system ATPase subunit
LSKGARAGTIVATETGLRLRCRAEPQGEVETGEVSILLRPERIHVEAPGGHAAPGQNRLSARIDNVTYLGEDLHLSLDLVGGERLRASVKNSNAARGWAPAQSVELVVDAADLRLLRR